jgi:hypothetical protein
MIVCISHAKVGYRHAIFKTAKPGVERRPGFFVSSGHDALFAEATQEAHEHFLAVDDIVKAVQA